MFGQQYENMAPESTLRNTVFYGAIQHYHGTATTAMKGALDFVALQTARYSGMTLITLIGQLTHEYKCLLSELINAFGYATALESWETYSAHSNTYMRAGHTDVKWPYVKEFNPNVFSKLSYGPNYWLCQFLATMIDQQLYSDTFDENGYGDQIYSF